MAAGIPETPQEGQPSPETEPSDNPFAKGLNVTVSVPQTVEVRMVDAAALADYEILFFISSILGSAVVGFLIALIQESGLRSQRWLACFTGVLAVLFLIFVAWTLRKRYVLTRKSKTVSIQYAQVEQKPKRRRRSPTARGSTNPSSVAQPPEQEGESRES
jgi:hypothetical protein